MKEKTWEGHADFARGSIKMFIAQLEFLRAMSPNPPELDWEIRVYRFMLEDPGPQMEAYMAARNFTMHPEGRSKREVVRELGWIIP